MKKTIAVTGSNGMIGSAVICQLLASGFHVIAIVRTLSKKIPQTNLEYREADMRDTETLIKALKSVDTVIHLAARKSDEKDSEATNVHGAQNLVTACKVNGIHSIINISTQSVRLQKKGTYASTKAAADHILQSSGIPTITLLPSVVYRDDQSGILQSLFTFTNLPIVPVIGSGETTYYPIHVDDLATIIVQCLNQAEMLGQSFDVGGRQAWTFNQLIDAIVSLRGLKKHKIHLPIWLCLLLASATRWLPKPPLSHSNVLGATENIPMNPEPVLQITHVEPRTFTQGLQEVIAMRQIHEKEAEAVGLLRYIGQSFDKKFCPSRAHINHFQAACNAHRLEHSRPLNTSLLKNISRLQALDSWSRLHDSQCTFQRKLLIACAIIECDPISAPWLLPQKRSVLHILALCIGTATSAIFSVIAGHLYSIFPSFTRNARL